MEVARVLLEQGADTEAQDEDVWSPLEAASGGEYFEAALGLLEHGVDVKAQYMDRGDQTPLHFAGREARGEDTIAAILLGFSLNTAQMRTP